VYSFEQAISLIQVIINKLIENKPTIIKIEHRKDGIYTSNLPDIHQLNNSEFILGIKLTDATNDMHENIVNSLKIASVTDITNIVNLQVAGINFNTVHTLPFYITYNENILYLKIERDNNL